MALWFSLCSGFIFNKLLLWRSFGGLGPGLEPGKGINYTPFSYSLSVPPLPLSSLAFLALSSSHSPSLLSSPFPFFFLLSPSTLSLFPAVLPACHLSLGFYYSISVFRFLLSASLLHLAGCTRRSFSSCLAVYLPSPYSSLYGGGSGRGKSKEKTGPLNPGFLQRPSPRGQLGAAGVSAA